MVVVEGARLEATKAHYTRDGGLPNVILKLGVT